MGVPAAGDVIVDAPNLFSGLDTPDCLALRIGSNLIIHGWLFSFDSIIEAVYVTCNGLRITADYPVKRPHVGDAKGAWINATAAFPQHPYETDLDCAIDPPYNFGFVTSPIPLDSTMGQSVDISLIAVVNGQEFIAQSRKIALLWSDPLEDIFNLGAIAPFKSVVGFDQNQLSTYDDCAPVFLIGSDCAMQRTLGALQARDVCVADASIFAQMRDAIVTCYDTYFEFNLLYFSGLENQKNGCAIKKFDIYGVLNAIVDSFHQQLQGMHRTHFSYALIGEKESELIPLLQAIYPRGVFVHIQTQADATEHSAEHHLAATMRVLKNGRARLALQEIELDSADTALSDACAIDRVADLIRDSRNIAGKDGDQSGASKNLPRNLDRVATQDYLHALPVYNEHRPIFILGAGRSGTSALTAALMGAGIAGFGEGHVFPLINEMAKRLWDLESLYATPGDVKSEIRKQTIYRVVDTCFQQIYGDLGSAIWLDKTADHVMINCIPFLKEMFPRARFIFLRRHPIAVAESRRRKFGSTPFFAILEWNESIKAWSKHKSLLAQSHIFECDANELRTSQLHARLGEFLGLHNQRSKTVADYLSVKTPEMTRHFPHKNLHAHYSGLEESRRFAFDALLLSVIESFDVYIEDTDWDANTISWVKNALGMLPVQFGYEIHRPRNLLIDSVIPLVMQIDEQKYTAASNAMTTTYWKEQHAHQLANAHYWKEQCRQQTAVAMRWKSQIDHLQEKTTGKFRAKWVYEIIGTFRERFNLFRKS